MSAISDLDRLLGDLEETCQSRKTTKESTYQNIVVNNCQEEFVDRKSNNDPPGVATNDLDNLLNDLEQNTGSVNKFAFKKLKVYSCFKNISVKKRR